MFFTAVLLNSFGMIMNFLSYCYLGQHFFTSTMLFFKKIALIVLAGTSAGIFCSLLTIQQIEQLGHFEGWIQLVINLVVCIVYLFFIKLIFQKTSIIHLLLLFCISEMIYGTIHHLTTVFIISSTLYDRIFTFSMPLFYIFFYSIVFILFLQIIKLFQKLKLHKYLNSLFDQSRLSLIIIFLYLIADSFLGTVYAEQSLILLICYFSFVLIISYLVYSITKKVQLTASKEIFQQQVVYSVHLEKTQKEIQMIHQNYKKIIEQLYQRSLEKDTLAIKQTIKQEVIQVDQTVSKHLKQINQLGKIEFIELKGLVLTKIMEAEKKGLNLFVEVQEPIDAIAMETSDILRCIGILLDNAIEESIHAEQNSLTLLLLKENGIVTIIVKNSFRKQPILHQIWQEGFSTKGENRGLGLSNLRQIISNYHNVFQDTRIEQQQFIQILKIKNL